MKRNKPKQPRAKRKPVGIFIGVTLNAAQCRDLAKKIKVFDKK